MLVGMTPWDIVLMFGSTSLPATVGAGARSAQGGIRIDAVIRMSPQHAKATLRSLQNIVAEYERSYGDVRIPDPEEV